MATGKIRAIDLFTYQFDMHLLDCTEGPTQGPPPLQVRERLLYPTPQDALHRDHCPQDEYHPCTERERRKRRVSSI